MEEAITTRESMCAEQPLEIGDTRSIRDGVVSRGKQLQPDRVLVQAAQAEHPLERNRKVAAAFAIFCGKPAAEENGHAERKRENVQRPTFN